MRQYNQYYQIKGFFCLFFSVVMGCAPLESSAKGPLFAAGLSVDGSPQGVKSLTNVKHVYIGMTYDEVMQVMGKQLIIGYHRTGVQQKEIQPITLKNPYRVELLKGNYREYEVVYYLTKVQNPDGIIAEDELTPMVFKQKKLIGKGFDFLFHLKDRLKL